MWYPIHHIKCPYRDKRPLALILIEILKPPAKSWNCQVKELKIILENSNFDIEKYLMRGKATRIIDF